jgi:hypothetical protein
VGVLAGLTAVYGLAGIGVAVLPPTLGWVLIGLLVAGKVVFLHSLGYTDLVLPRREAKEGARIDALARETLSRNGNGFHANGNGAHASGAHANGNGVHVNGNGVRANGNGIHANGNGVHKNGNGKAKGKDEKKSHDGDRDADSNAA